MTGTHDRSITVPVDMSSSIDPRLHSTNSFSSSSSQQQPQHSFHPDQQHQSSSTSNQPPRLPRIHPAPEYHLPPPQQLPYQNQSYYSHPPPQVAQLEHGFPTPQSQINPYGAEGGSPAEGANADDQKRSRACEACRGLKVRCDQDPDHPDQPCKRCAKAKRRCVITAPTRKRQKKTDSRVAELEKKIDALTATLQAQNKEIPKFDDDDSASQSGSLSETDSTYNRSQSQESPDQKRGQEKLSLRQHARGFKRRRNPQDSPPLQDTSALSRPTPYLGRGDSDYGQSIPQLVDEAISQIIDQETAAKIFERYCQDMAIHLPTVVFPKETTAEDVRRETPILFLSILVAASVGMTALKTQQELAQVLLGAFADRVIRHTEKSVSLIRALLVATIWYRPPTRYEQMNFYQLTHIAAVMAIDIGMGKKMHPSRRKQIQSGNEPTLTAQYRNTANTDTLEARRTWLGCYFLCANTSIFMRRPNLIRWNAYMDECIDMLENSVDALPTDKLLCQHVKLQHINEEIGQKFCMDDPSASIHITDPRVQTSMKIFEYQIREWKRAVSDDEYTHVVSFSHNVSNLYMHEVALHSNHNVDDFRAPFTEESLQAPSSQSGVLSEPHAVALHDCLDAVNAMFKTFLSFDVSVLRALPIFYFVRIAYGVVILFKLYFAVTAPNSEVGKIITKSDLDAENQIDKLLRLFHAVDDEDAFRPANRFLMILARLRDWFQKRKANKEGYGPPASAAPFEDPKPNTVPAPPSAPSEAGSKTSKKSNASGSPKTPPARSTRGGSGGRGQTPKRQRESSTQQSQSAHKKYDNSTPLHFLSDVATSSAPPANPGFTSSSSSISGPAGAPAAYSNQSGLPTQYSQAHQHHQQQQEDDYGFEQAMDMTLGNWFPVDFSSLFNSSEQMFGNYDPASVSAPHQQQHQQQQQSQGHYQQQREGSEVFGGTYGGGGWS